MERRAGGDGGKGGEHREGEVTLPIKIDALVFFLQFSSILL